MLIQQGMWTEPVVLGLAILFSKFFWVIDSNLPFFLSFVNLQSRIFFFSSSSSSSFFVFGLGVFPPFSFIDELSKILQNNKWKAMITRADLKCCIHSCVSVEESFRAFVNLQARICSFFSCFWLVGLRVCWVFRPILFLTDGTIGWVRIRFCVYVCQFEAKYKKMEA